MTPIDYDVIIVGSGPIGLLLANLLAPKDLHVLILERRTELPTHSQAIGITPPSLEILATLGLDETFVREGVKIQDCFVHDNHGELGCCSFRKLAGNYPFILSLPQKTNVTLLEKNISSQSQIVFAKGAEVYAIHRHQNFVQVEFLDAQNAAKKVAASYVVACDGNRSRIREILKTSVKEKTYGCHFVMADFPDNSGMGDDAHLFFTEEGAVESFPLPQGKRRWIVQTSVAMKTAPQTFISEQVRQRTGIFIPFQEQISQTWFTPRRLDCEDYVQDRVILCGDAAHVMSPIGGQGMNVGFGDAALLAQTLGEILQHGQPAAPLLQTYSRKRQRVAKAAADHAAAGMWLGTRKGRLQSTLRSLLMREIFFSEPMSEKLGPHFAMQTLPKWTD